MKIFLFFYLIFHSSMALSETLWVNLDELAPTQMNIGLIAMGDKVSKIEKKDKKGNLLKYLGKKFAPAFIGPDGRFPDTTPKKLSSSVVLVVFRV